MKSLACVLAVGLLVASSGCLMAGRLRLTDILLLSSFYSPTNYTAIEKDVLADDQTVVFYLETRGFATEKSEGGWEFWVSIDIIIYDEDEYRYVEEIDEKEIHITNATERPGMVWYTFPFFTGNMVRSGSYWVRISVKDRLSDRVAQREKEFYIDLSRQPE
jgi:hypothetical protein